MPDSERPTVDEPVRENVSPRHDDNHDLSPSVRRLVRHYDLDITAIRGSGPAGRIRVGDVMPLLGARDPGAAVAAAAETDTAPDGDERERQSRADALPAARVERAGADRFATAVFECDLGRVLNHQKRATEHGENIALLSYFALACARGLATVPALNGDATRYDVAVLHSAGVAAKVLRNVRELSLRDFDRSLRVAESPDAAPTFAIRNHGGDGSIVTLHGAPAAGTHATLGVGKVRKVVAVKSVDGVDTPRITAQCYLSLSFDTCAVSETQANRFLGECVRVLETYNTAAIASTT